MVVAAKHLSFDLTPQQKYFLADDAREVLIQELENMGNMKSIVVLAELCLILATKWERYECVKCLHLQPLPWSFIDRSIVQVFAITVPFEHKLFMGQQMVLLHN